jgi:hypothetical protein
VVINSSPSKGGREQAIRRIFQEAGIALLSQSIGGGGFFAILRYPLPSSVKEAAELVRELLLRGCVVPERPILHFRLHLHSGA